MDLSDVFVYISMNTLDFKSWLEAMMGPTGPLDPKLQAAQQAATTAAKQAIMTKQNPIKAAQKAVLAANVPTNKLGKVMPTEDDEGQLGT